MLCVCRCCSHARNCWVFWIVQSYLRVLYGLLLPFPSYLGYCADPFLQVPRHHCFNLGVLCPPFLTHPTNPIHVTIYSGFADWRGCRGLNRTIGIESRVN